MSSSDSRVALVTGATGFIGGRLANALTDDGWHVRALVRDRGRASHLADRGIELVEGDVLDADSLRGAGEGAEIAYYLVHGMGRGGEGDFEEREREAATNFAEMAKREGVRRVVYLGGLGDEPRSKHLRSRAQTAEILSEHGPALTYFRAAMVGGPRARPLPPPPLPGAAPPRHDRPGLALHAHPADRGRRRHRLS